MFMSRPIFQETDLYRIAFSALFVTTILVFYMFLFSFDEFFLRKKSLFLRLSHIIVVST